VTAQELLEVFFRHHDTEQTADVEATMQTVTADIVYEHPFRLEDRLVAGPEAVRAYYERNLAVRDFQDFRVVRTWTSGEDTLVLEYALTVARAGGEPRPSRGVVIVEVRDGRVAREIVYNGLLT
jgi:ketosteroid isomerase-like protein